MQPIWKTVWATDRSRLLEDTTGVYGHELEVAEEIDDENFELYRYEVPQLKRCPDHETAPCKCLIPLRWDASWRYGSCAYDEWFVKDLAAIAATNGTTEQELRDALCSDDVNARVWAYESIAGYHGNHNFDSYPLTLSNEELDERWS